MTKTLSESPSRGPFKTSQQNISDFPSPHPFTCPRNFPSKYPSNVSFRKPYSHNPLPHTQPTTHPLHPLAILPLAQPLLNLTHGIYQATLVATRVTLYSLSRMYFTYRSSPIFSRAYSHVWGLSRYSNPDNSHILSLIFTVDRI